MHAVLLTGFGGVDKLELREVPDPRPQAGEVRVHVIATSINPVDWKIRSGSSRGRQPVEPPDILGRDVAGDVVELGTAVTSLHVGDRVMGLVRRTYAEQLVAPADALCLIPDGMDYTQAAALPLVLTTGAQLIEEAIQPRAGDTVLVTGALGGVGRTAVYVAKQLGVRVLAGVRARQREEARALGADSVVALDDEASLKALPKLDAIADTVGGEVIGKLLAALKPGGRLGSVLGEAPAAKGKDVVVRAFMAHADAGRLRALASAVARGEFRIPVANVFPLDQVREAQQKAERGGAGKLVLRT